MRTTRHKETDGGEYYIGVFNVHGEVGSQLSVDQRDLSRLLRRYTAAWRILKNTGHLSEPAELLVTRLEDMKGIVDSSIVNFASQIRPNDLSSVIYTVGKMPKDLGRFEIERAIQTDLSCRSLGARIAARSA